MSSASNLAITPALSWPESSQWMVWLCRLSLLVAILLTYANSFQGEFVFDDKLTIVDSSDLHDLSDLEGIFLGREGGLPVRPLPYFTFALNYAWDGLNPFYYHAVNVLIHIASAWFAFDILRWTFNSSRIPREIAIHSLLLAWITTLLWSVHPLQTMAITYVYQRMESLMACCYLATLWCFLFGMRNQSHSHRWLLASIGCCFLGMASKEVMITAPLLILWYDRVFIASSWTEIRKQRTWYYISLVATSVVLFAALYSQRGRYAELTVAKHSGLAYLMNQPRVLLLYAQLIFWPLPQCIDYNWPVSYDILSLLPAIIPVTLLVTWILRNLIKHPQLAFSLGSVFLILSVTSSIVAVQDLVMEHRMYLPSIPLFASLVFMIYLVAIQVAKRVPAISQSSFTPAAIATSLLLAILLGYRTHVRNRDYADYETMWAQVLEVVPLSRRARTKWVATMAQQKKLPQLLKESQTLVEKYPQQPVALLTRAEALQLNKEWSAVIPIAKQVLDSPEHADEAHFLLASSYSAMQQSDLAVKHYNDAISLNPIFMHAWVGLGRELALHQQYQDAIRCFRQAIAVHRHKSDALQDLAVLLDLQGESEEAASLFAEYLRINPRHISARCNYANLLLRQKQPAQAIEQLTIALQEQPTNAQLHAQLAAAYLANQQQPLALASLKTSLTQEASSPIERAETQIFAADLYVQMQNPAEAVLLLMQAVEEPTTSLEAAMRLARLQLDRNQPNVFNPAAVVSLLLAQQKSPQFVPAPEISWLLATAQLEIDQPSLAAEAAQAGLREIHLPQQALWRQPLQQVLLQAKERLVVRTASPAKS